MQTIQITAETADFQKFIVLKTNRNKRHRYEEFLVEGVRNINQAVASGWEIVSFIYGGSLSDWARGLISKIETRVNYCLSAALMALLSGKEDASELLAVVRMRGNLPFQLPENPVLALFDRPSNKGNLGTVLRSCDALGVSGLIITGHAVDVYEPEVVAASMGSFFKVPFQRLSAKEEVEGALAKLRSRFPALRVVGTTAHAATPIYEVDLTGPVLFLIGNETDGLSHYYRQICGVSAVIPMNPEGAASSFNVAAAATVFFYEAARQRKSLLG